MRYGSVQNAEIHLFCSENRNFIKKELPQKGAAPKLWYEHLTSEAFSYRL